MSDLWVLTFKVKSQNFDLLFELFDDQAFSCATIENEAEGFWMAEVVFPSPQPDIAAIQEQLNTAIPAFEGECWDWNVHPLPDTDWLAQNRRDFPPVSIGRYGIFRDHHLHPRIHDTDIALVLEAGTAFGSGTHESTQGCLRALSDLSHRTTFKHILDVGCGSGILAIAAAHTWPDASVTASDNDPEAIRVTQRNAERNHVHHHIQSYHADDLNHPKLQGPFDLIIANILLEPLQRIAPALRHALTPQGYVVLSGLLADQKDCLLESYIPHGFLIQDTLVSAPWMTLVLTTSA